jgi:hypothetical protein
MNSNYNNLLEFGGTGDLIATAICDFSFNGIDYKTGDMVLSLTGAGIHFNYGATTSNIKSNRNQVYYNEYYLDSFVVDTAPLNFQMQRLFVSMFNQAIEITEHEQPMSMGGTILLLNNIDSESHINIPGITEFTLVNHNGVSIINSKEFVDGTTYDVYYTRIVEGSLLELDNKDSELPYLKIQIKFNGNQNKNTMSNYFIVDKAALRLTPVFNLKDNAVSHVQIMFKVIDGVEKPKLSVITNGN